MSSDPAAERTRRPEMSNRGFLLIIVGVLVLGGLVGGAFVAGLVVGRGADDEEVPQVLTLPAPAGSEPSTTEPAAPPGDIQSLGEVFQRIQSGEITQEEAAQLRQMFQGGGFGGPGGRPGAGLAGGGVLAGTVESVEDGRIVINTPQGSLEVNVVPETVIQRTEVSILTAGELSEGTQVQIMGQPGETGAVDAASIFVVPEGAGAFGGFGGRGIPGLGDGQ